MNSSKLEETKPLLDTNKESTKKEPDKSNGNSEVYKRISVQTSCILGIGTVSVAFVLKAGGLILGLLTLIISAILAQYTLRLLSRCAKIYRIQTYGELAFLTFGKTGKRMTTFTILLLCIGSQIGYLRFLGDSLPDLIGHFAGNGLSKDSIWRDEKWLVTFASLVIIYPLCLVKQITKLSFTSALSVSAAVWTMIAAVIEGCRHFSKDGFDAHEIRYFRFSMEIFLALPIATFAFICHTALFPVLKGLGQPIEKRANIITGSAILISFTVYLIISLFGYFIFFDKTNGDLLNSFSESSGIANSARIAMSITMCFISPVFFFVTRDAYVETFMPKTKELSGWKFFLITTFLFGIELIGSLYVPNIVVAFDLTSAIAGSLIMFVLPSLYYLKLRYIEANFPNLSSFNPENSKDQKNLKNNIESKDDNQREEKKNGNENSLNNESKNSENSSITFSNSSEIENPTSNSDTDNNNNNQQNVNKKNDEDDDKIYEDGKEDENIKILKYLTKEFKKKNFHKFSKEYIKFSKNYPLAVLILIFGVLSGAVCTAATILSIVRKKT
ncbi:amino acid transporter [Anaeramoeba flamelloides]|uniref:Amino acid transporter n=1 Tax=Anaeramoeba flamelloides TaxID=1746091 RepID=A0AAV7ZRM9_9EUKA|nr:amino acid transporter [Anaeramoeba flamelloides]